MRIFISKLLVAGALFFFSASSASALAISLGGLDATAAPGSTVSVTVTIDTETLTGITLLSVGVLFDDAKLTYNKGLSSATMWMQLAGQAVAHSKQATQRTRPSSSLLRRCTPRK